MKTNLPSKLILAVIWLAAWPAPGQQTATAPATVASSSGVPSLINYSGVLKDAEGKTITGVTGVTFLLYKEEQGGAPLWLETQNVTPDNTGHYTVPLGAASANGLPADLFSSGEARWLAVQIANEPEQPRVVLVAVPYAMKAVDAETVGGLPPSAFVLAASKVTGTTPANASSKVSTSFAPPPTTSTVTTSGGTVTTLPLWTTATNIQSSVVTQIGSGASAKIGINTSTPAATLDVKGPEIVRGTLTLPTTGTSMKVSGTIQAADGTFPLLMNSVTCCQSGNRMIWAHDPKYPNWGVYYDDNADNMNWRTAAGGEFLTADFPDERIGIGTTAPTDQLSVVALSSSVKAITAQGFTAASGSNLNGTHGVVGTGGNGDPSAPNTGPGSRGGAGVVGIGGTGWFSGGDGIDGYGGVGTSAAAYGGNGVVGFGAAGSLTTNALDGSGGVFTGGSGCGCGGGGFADGVDAYPGDGYAGYFAGDLFVTGQISAGTKDFKIDHPLDPANKYLVHSSVESSEMKNIYDGVVTTDAQGTATVQLPEWFEVLNTDFRYQLTVIGVFAQAIVSREIQNDQFEIRTNLPSVKVSWQVTGVRQDAYAKAHPLVVEEEKNARLKGFYIHPELYGASEEKQIEWARHPQMMKRIKEVHAKQIADSQPQQRTPAR